MQTRIDVITNPASLAAIIARETRATPLKSAAISQLWDDTAKAKAFFSARVASADILEGLREQINMVVGGQMTSEQAALWCREFLKSQGDSALTSMGFLPAREALGEGTKTAPITELGSSPRLRLIVEQNVRMAEAAADWESMMDAADLLPYVRYHTAGDGEVRDEHAMLDGGIWRKDDPELRRIYPPNGYNCRCWVEEVAEDEVEGEPIRSGAPDGWDQFEQNYSYDPASYNAQTIEAKANWGSDLTAAYNTESAEYQTARVADLERRRDIMLAAANNSTNPREIGEALQTANEIDKRIQEIKKDDEGKKESEKNWQSPDITLEKSLEKARSEIVSLATHERFYAYSATGELLIPPYNSGPSGGELPKEWIGKLEGAVLYHNHPSGARIPERLGFGSSFSMEDIKTASDQKLGAIYAASRKRTYVMEPVGKWPKKRKIIDSYNELNEKTSMKGWNYIEKARNPADIEVRKNRMGIIHGHLVMKNLAKFLNMRYTVIRHP